MIANGGPASSPPPPAAPPPVKMTRLQRVSMAINRAMEVFFYRWGFLVASHPWHCIVATFSLTLLCCLGMLNFRIENRPFKLWLRADSPFALDTNWLHEHIQAPLRPSMAMVTAEDNVLTPEVVKLLAQIHREVRGIRAKGKSFEDLCYKLPITKMEESRRRRRRRRRRKREVNATEIPDPLFGREWDGFEDEFEDTWFSENEVDAPQGKKEGGEGDEGGYDPQTFDPMLSLPEDVYCFLLENMDEACYEVNPVELWSYNETQVENVTSDEVIDVFNNRLISPVFGRFVNYTAELGGLDIQRNAEGKVVKAQSIELKWFLKVNHAEILAGNGITDESTGEVADSTTMEWESEFMLVLQSLSEQPLPPGVHLYYATRRSFGDICMGQINKDGLMLAVGFLVMFAYVSIMLGRWNAIEQRPLVSVAGIFCIGFSVIIACGICSAFSIFSGPVNQILPFLILGIGVDDMFIIVQCWNNLEKEHPKKPGRSIPDRMGSALQHAGVSITVTSLTDIAAFGVGAFTTLPGLQSFAIYAAMSVLAVFFLQSTWFVAWFAIDQQRLEGRRNGMCCCIQYSTENTNIANNKLNSSNNRKTFCQLAFNDIFTRYLLTSWMVKLTVILTTAALLATTVYGSLQLEQDFDPMWLLPANSHLVKFLNAREAHYPGIGVQGMVITNQVDWARSFGEMEQFTHDFRDSGCIYKFDSWYDDFKLYANKNFHTDIPRREVEPRKLSRYMGKFLYSPAGSKHRAHFRFDGHFRCGEKMPPVRTVMMPFQFKYFDNMKSRIAGMREVKRLAKHLNLTFTEGADDPRVFAWAIQFVQWESDETMAAELVGSVSLSLTCVMITIFLLLADLRMCLICGICVVFTMINVGGFMFYWGIAINIISSILIVLSIGLCVDYAAHVGLAFLITPGPSRVVRAQQALQSVGTAVLNGGISTFLSVSLMAASKSLAFISFFKIFTIVVICGLWHGLVFLPVLLSLVGPAPYPNAVFAQTPPPQGEANGKNSSFSGSDNNLGRRRRGRRGEEDVEGGEEEAIRLQQMPDIKVNSCDTSLDNSRRGGGNNYSNGGGGGTGEGNGGGASIILLGEDYGSAKEALMFIDEEE